MNSLLLSFALAILIGLTGLVSCTTTSPREVATTSSPNAEHLRYLQHAAEAGILFIIADGALRDVPSKQIGSCRKSEDALWAENLYGLLEGLDRNQRLYSKIHVIEIRRGNAPTAVVEKDPSGLTRFVVSYVRHTKFEKISSLTELPCANPSGEMVNGNLETTTFDWPLKEYAISTLAEARDKPNLEKFQFDKKLLLFLADHLTLLRVTPEQLTEKNAAGEYTLGLLLNRVGTELAAHPKMEHVEFWLTEIGIRSKQAMGLEFFSFVAKEALSYGIKVDSTGKFARKINNYSEPTYLYLTYKTENNSLTGPGLQDLNTCLASLSALYRTPNFVNTFETDKESYLYPGYHCGAEAP